VVGWTANNEIVLAGPHFPRKDNQRFLAARGLYHALFSCERSERLVTSACSWDQQVSRAFAAELLAPQTALIARVSGNVDHSKVEELAKEFVVSTVVIEKQLRNAGATLVDE
jgi:Zn-dependent peptidase ImmA (M78 family)